MGGGLGFGGWIGGFWKICWVVGSVDRGGGVVYIIRAIAAVFFGTCALEPFRKMAIFEGFASCLELPAEMLL